MERTPIEISRNIVDLESARFTDQLTPEQEQTWEDLVESLAATQEGNEAIFTGYRKLAPILKDLWLDPEVPVVYRDRAMLELMKRFYVFNDPTGISTSGGWGSEHSAQIVKFTEEELEHRDAWYLNALNHTLQTGDYVLGVTKTYMLAIELFDNRLIDENTLETTLDCIATTNPGFEQGVLYETSDKQPRSYKKLILSEYARYDTDQYSKLESNRFPVIEDILNGSLLKSSGGRARAWALQQLNAWLDYKADMIDEGELPLWLSSVNDDNDGLTRGFFYRRRQDVHRAISYSRRRDVVAVKERPGWTPVNSVSNRRRVAPSSLGNGFTPVIPWELYEKAVHIFGWGMLTTEIAANKDGDTTQKCVRMRLDYILDLAEQISSKEFANELLLYFLRTYYTERDNMPEAEEKPETYRDGAPQGLDRVLFGNSKDIELIDKRLSSLSGDSELVHYLTRIKRDLMAKGASRTAHFERQRAESEQRDAVRVKERQQREAARQIVADKLPDLLSKLKAEVPSSEERE